MFSQSSHEKRKITLQNQIVQTKNTWRKLTLPDLVLNTINVALMWNRCYKTSKNTKAFEINKLIYDINYQKLHLPIKLGLFIHKATVRHIQTKTKTQMLQQKNIHTTFSHKCQSYRKIFVGIKFISKLKWFETFFAFQKV